MQDVRCSTAILARGRCARPRCIPHARRFLGIEPRQCQNRAPVHRAWGGAFVPTPQDPTQTNVCRWISPGRVPPMDPASGAFAPLNHDQRGSPLWKPDQPSRRLGCARDQPCTARSCAISSINYIFPKSLGRPLCQRADRYFAIRTICAILAAARSIVSRSARK